MVTPFYIAVILPAIFLQSPDIEFTTALALAPVVNVALLIREAIMGSIPPLQSALTLGSMAVCVALSVVFAQWVMRREEVLVGSQRGGLGGFLRRRVRGRRREA